MNYQLRIALGPGVPPDEFYGPDDLARWGTILGARDGDWLHDTQIVRDVTLAAHEIRARLVEIEIKPPYVRTPGDG